MVRVVLTTHPSLSVVQPRSVYFVYTPAQGCIFYIHPCPGVYILYLPMVQGCIFYIYPWFRGVYFIFTPGPCQGCIFSFTPLADPLSSPHFVIFRPQSVICLSPPPCQSSHHVTSSGTTLGMPWNMFVTYHDMWHVTCGMPWNMFVTYPVMRYLKYVCDISCHAWALLVFLYLILCPWYSNNC